jgi:hypothetical protein
MKTELKKTKVNKIISFIGWVWVAVWYFLKLAWPVVRWFFSFYLFFKLVSVFWLMGKPNAYPWLELFGVIFVYMFFDWLVRFYVPSPLKNLAGKNG